MAERLHFAVVNKRGFISELFPHGEIGLGGANEHSRDGEMVIFLGQGSQYQDAENGTVVHGLKPQGEIPADNIAH